MARSVVRLPSDVRSPFDVYVNGVRQQLGEDYHVQEGALIFQRELRKDRISGWRWFLGAWGVGTRLVTGADDAALGGVYKLSAVRDPGGSWTPRIKLSEQSAKISVPGLLQTRRFIQAGEFAGDLIYDLGDGEPSRTLVDMLDVTRRKTMPPDASHEDLLVPVVRTGKVVYEAPALADSRARTRQQLAGLHPGIKRFVNPHQYPVGLDVALHERRTRMILEARDR